MVAVTPMVLTQEDIQFLPALSRLVNVFDAFNQSSTYKQAWSVPFALLVELEKMVANGKLDKHCVNGLRYHQNI